MSSVGFYELNSIDFSSPTVGYISATETAARPKKGYLFVTTNGGLNWNLRLQHRQPLYGVSFGGTGFGYAIGNQGHLLKTSNSGQNWQILMGTIGYSGSIDMHFPSNKTGYIIAIDTAGGYSISKTINAGNSWLSFPVPSLPTLSAINSIFFSDTLNGYVCGNNGLLYKTTNGGQDWLSQNSGVGFDLKEIYFVSPSTGFVVGGQSQSSNVGVVLKTTNGGANWSLNNTTNFQLNTLSFTGSQIGYVAGFGGLIMKTTNAGQSWITQNSSPFEVIEKLSVGNPNYAVALMAGSRKPLINIYGNNNWQFATSFDQFNFTVFTTLACRDHTTIFAGISLLNLFDVVIATNPSSPFVYVSQNTSVDMKTHKFMRVVITSNMNSFALDNQGVVLKNFDQITSNRPKTKPTRQALAFELFPNPSSGQCIIQTTNWQQTSLTVMDILGKSIYTQALTNPKTTLSLAKGVYFVRLSGPQGQGMQKLVVE